TWKNFRPAASRSDSAGAEKSFSTLEKEGRKKIQKNNRANDQAKVQATIHANRQIDNQANLQQENLRVTNQRRPIPAAIKHQVFLRDQGACQHINTTTGEVCCNKRFVEVHHKKPVSQGGKNDLDNLITLCSGHHKVTHMA